MRCLFQALSQEVESFISFPYFILCFIFKFSCVANLFICQQQQQRKIDDQALKNSYFGACFNFSRSICWRDKRSSLSWQTKRMERQWWIFFLVCGVFVLLLCCFVWCFTLSELLLFVVGLLVVVCCLLTSSCNCWVFSFLLRILFENNLSLALHLVIDFDRFLHTHHTYKNLKTTTTTTKSRQTLFY